MAFDFATQLDLPMIARQTQRGYMAETFGLDVNEFGIVDEGRNRQTNVLYTEGFGHDSNFSISSLHWYLTKHNPAVGRASVVVRPVCICGTCMANSRLLSNNLAVQHFWSDSCVGENRNNYVLSYFKWRVAMGFHDEVRWSFKVVGHTKNKADQGFGYVRLVLKRTGWDVFTMPDLIEAIAASTEESGYNEAVEPPDEIFRNFKAIRTDVSYTVVRSFFFYIIENAHREASQTFRG